MFAALTDARCAALLFAALTHSDFSRRKAAQCGYTTARVRCAPHGFRLRVSLRAHALAPAFYRAGGFSPFSPLILPPFPPFPKAKVAIKMRGDTGAQPSALTARQTAFCLPCHKVGGPLGVRSRCGGYAATAARAVTTGQKNQTRHAAHIACACA